MGLLSGKDIYSSKYTTADIQGSGRVWYVPIKYVIGNYFLAQLDGLIYCFKLDDTRIKTYRHSLIKSFRKVYYTTDNYLPISSEDITNLENVLKINDLPNVERNLLKTFQILGKREKKEFEAHDLLKLVEEIGQYSEKYKEEVQNMKNFLDELGSKKIITPLKKLSEYLEGDLIATDPQFMGSIVSQSSLVETAHKKVTNTPLTGKTPWMKMIAILAIIGIIAGLAYYAYSSGAISNISIPGLSSTTNPGDIMKQYPDPAVLKQQIAEGKVKYADLPPEVKKLVDATKLPATPIPIPQK